jgi:hypothetical protein
MFFYISIFDIKCPETNNSFIFTIFAQKLVIGENG